MNLSNQKIKTRTLEEYEQVMTIRKKKKGQGILKISRKTGVPTNTIRDWIYRGVKPKRLRKTKILREEAKILSPELAYILGVIKGDGCLLKFRRKNMNGECYDYSLVLGVTDEDFADYFAEQVEKWSIFKIYKTKYFSKQENRKDRYIIRLRSKDVYEFLYNYDLSLILSSNEKTKGMFLKGFYDSEGTVTKNIKSRSIIVGVINLKVISLVRELLKSMNIPISDLKIRDKKPYQKFYYFRISSVKGLELFRDKIGFSIKRKQNRLVELLNCLPSSIEILKIKENNTNNKKNLYKLIRKNPGLSRYEISKKLNWGKGKTENYLNFLSKNNLINKVSIEGNNRPKQRIYLI